MHLLFQLEWILLPICQLRAWLEGMSLQDSVRVHSLERRKGGLLMRGLLGVRVVGKRAESLSLCVMYDRGPLMRTIISLTFAV